MVLDKTPAYVRVYNTLRSRILDGDYALGDLLPPEPELEKQFLVSRTTVRKAVELLSREGLVEAKQGRGTRVLDYHTTQNINVVSSLSETLERKGCKVYCKNMYIDTVPASARVANELHIQAGDPVILIQRLQIADDLPIAIFKNYLIPDLVPGIQSYAGKFSRLYDFLEEQYGLLIDGARDRISARSATFEEASMLDVPVGTALIYLVRVCYSGGRIVGSDHCRILGSRYEFEVQMTGRRPKS
ncbi:MAG TPA: GntR family transcriptional regulator [Candidatus Limiplasma pullicola]|nr:GntR family transcriptional regulator [Candidatus Limiplasma pullicola]